MLVIRFFRVGKKNQPSFKIVVTDKRNAPQGGRFVEEVGFWNPLTKEKVIKTERIKHWLSVGAKASDTVYNILIKEKILEGKKIPLHKRSKKPAPKTEEPKSESKKNPEPVAQSSPEASASGIKPETEKTPEAAEKKENS